MQKTLELHDNIEIQLESHHLVMLVQARASIKIWNSWFPALHGAGQGNLVGPRSMLMFW
jgi:hypothetical protein